MGKLDAGGKLGYREKGKSRGESWGPGGGEKFWEDAFPGVFGIGSHQQHLFLRIFHSWDGFKNVTSGSCFEDFSRGMFLVQRFFLRWDILPYLEDHLRTWIRS